MNNENRDLLAAEKASDELYAALREALKTASPVEALLIQRIRDQHIGVMQSLAELMHAMKKEPPCAG